jgi:peroxiredoxin family protein
VSGPVLILLQGSTWEARYQAVTVALTAAALGDPVHLALFFDPLRRWAEGSFEAGAPETAAPAGVRPLGEMLAEGRRELGIRLVACDTAVRLAGLTPEAAGRALDGIVGLTALWRLAQEGRALSF